MADGCFGLRPYFAYLDTLAPSVLKFSISTSPTVSEPGTAATATTNFPRFFDDATFGT